MIFSFDSKQQKRKGVSRRGLKYYDAPMFLGIFRFSLIIFPLLRFDFSKNSKGHSKWKTQPTPLPTSQPTEPTTPMPSETPTSQPTAEPTEPKPSSTPTSTPSVDPSAKPTVTDSSAPHQLLTPTTHLIRSFPPVTLNSWKCGNCRTTT